MSPIANISSLNIIDIENEYSRQHWLQDYEVGKTLFWNWNNEDHVQDPDWYGHDEVWGRRAKDIFTVTRC